MGESKGISCFEPESFKTHHHRVSCSIMFPLVLKFATNLIMPLRMFESILGLFVLPPARPLSTVAQHHLLEDRRDWEPQEAPVLKVKLYGSEVQETSCLD